MKKQEKSINPWDRVKVRKGKLVGMLTDSLAKNIMVDIPHITPSQSGLSIVHLPKTNRKR